MRENRLPQTPQNIAHHLRPGLGFGQFTLDAQLFVAGEFDVFVFLDQLDDFLSDQ